MKKVLFVVMVLVGILFLPFSVYAKEKEYNTLDLKGTLAAEEIDEAFESYNPKSDAITVYLFRGQGCGYCRAFLEFLNSITDEYGKYFKLQSYEVWNDTENSNLLNEVSAFLGQPAGGVPYIIIGDKVFAGYSSDYDDGIKETITTLYNTKKNKRYDVLSEYKKKGGKNSSSATGSTNIIIWQLVFTFVATVIIMSFINLKFKELYLRLDNNSNNRVKEETKSSPKKEHKK